MGSRWLLVLALVAIPAAAAEKSHVHGKASLDVAIEGSRITLEFEAPLEDLVGFERQAVNEKERAALSALDTYLKSGQAFVPSTAAGCKSAGATLATFSPGKGHAEMRATWKYECADPSSLKDLEARIFQQCPKLKRIDVRVVTPKGQSAARLTPSNRSLKL
jgi:hypothetical protein